MRLWLLLLLTVILLIVLIRTAIRLGNEPPDMQSHRPIPWISISVLAGLIVVAGYLEVRWRSVQTEATAVVQQMTEREDAAFVCERMSDALIFTGVESGHVQWDPGDERQTGATAWLSYATCSDLANWMRSDRRRALPEEILALHVLAHEAAHVSGHRDEAVTECLAMRAFPQMVQELGVDPAEADRMANVYRNLYYPQQAAEYLDDCASHSDVSFVPTDHDD